MGRIRQTKPDKAKLSGILEQIPEDRREVANDLLKELNFMSETLDELKAKVKSSGAVTLFEQGKQKMIIENPAMKSYNTTIQRYGAIYKQLIDLIPKMPPSEHDDGFEDFINGREDG